MTILGISASGRPEGVTAAAVRAVLEASGEPYDYVSLAGKTIVGCQGCTGCASDNRCVLDDDWPALGDALLAADALVFGAPNYFYGLNALGHAFWERTFCFRHREVFSLAGKLGVIVSVDYRGQDDPVADHIRRMMTSNLMPIVAVARARGHSQCYTCGYGADCAVGGVVGRHGFLDDIAPEHLPPHFAEQREAQLEAYKAGKTLGSILRARR